MRLIISALAALGLLAGFGNAAGASPKKKYPDHDRTERYDGDWRAYDNWFFDLFPGYQSRNPDNFRPGSRDWWKAMDKEGRGGHPRL
jgi:hypothetical protein